MLKLYYAETTLKFADADENQYAWEIHGKARCDLAHEDLALQPEWEEVDTTLEPLAELVMRLSADDIRAHLGRARFTICECAVSGNGRGGR